MSCKTAWIVVISVLVMPLSAQEADLSSPKAAAKSFYAALARGDGEGVRKMLVLDNDPEQKIVAAYVKLILAGKRLGDEAKKKFPGASDPFATGTISPEEAASIDSARVVVDGDNATLTRLGPTAPIKLRRVDGAWKVVVNDAPVPQEPQHRADQAKLFEGLADAMSQCADEIAANKYNSLEDAKAAVKDRMGAVVAKALIKGPATTQSATQPGQ